MHWQDLVVMDIGGHSVTARVSPPSAEDIARYIFDDDYVRGHITAQPLYSGLHPDQGVMVTFGPQHADMEVGDWAVAGTVACAGEEMTPRPHPDAVTLYPIDDIRSDDPATADLVALLASTIAAHYAAHYTGSNPRVVPFSVRRSS